MKKYIQDKSIYIVSDELKKYILSYLNENKLLLDIHFFTANEFIKRCYFSYDYKAIYMVSKEFNVSYSNAKMYIENIKYLMYSNKLNSNKYDFIYSIKEFLDRNNLIIYDDKFIDYIKGYNIITDIDLSNSFINRINELLNNKIQIIHNDTKKIITIYECKDSENEIQVIANNIGNLLSKDVNPNNIHILNYSNEYFNFINKIFTLYNIPFSLNPDTFLYDLPYVKKIYKEFFNSNEINIIDDYKEINNQIVDILNGINFINSNEDKKDFFLYLIKNTKVKNKLYDNVIQFDNNFGYMLDEHYYFFVGLNNKVFPKYKKDEDYFTDKEKIELGYNPSYILNKYSKNFYKSKFHANTNLYISYRNCDYFNKYMPSDVLNELNYSLVKNNDSINKYSLSYNKLKVTREIDNYYKYNNCSLELEYLLKIINTEEYKSYDNKYSEIDANYYLNNILNNNINISYSSLEKYSECNYKYYLDSLLKENEDRFTTYLGSLFHHVLEHVYDSDFNFDKLIKEYESDYTPSKLESILLNNLLKDFKNKIEIIKDQYNKTDLVNIRKEEHISIYKKTNLSIKIHGFIDKIMSDNFNNAIVIDYKTGDTKLTLDYLDYGIKCQLPFYFYLLNKSSNYANIFLVGCYLQILDFKIKSFDNKEKDMQLTGYTYNNLDVAKKIDNNLENDSFIKGIKPNSKGLGTYSKTYDEALFNEIINKMEININNMKNGLENVSFNINPKILKDNSTTCKFCKYKDICFHTFSDYIDLREGNEDEVDE